MLTAHAALTGQKGSNGAAGVGARPRAFSLIDVLVSIGVIAVLISLLLPTIGPVRETARQVACRAGVRQMGLGIAMFADDHQDWLPKSQWLNPAPGQPSYPAQSVCLTIDPDGPKGASGYQWDGLGILYGEQYLVTPGSFYCPSHKAGYKFSEQTDLWHNPAGVIVGNYQYRAGGPNPKVMTLTEIEPKRSALVSDSLRTAEEYNHVVGANVLRADLSVYWFDDRKQEIFDWLGKDDGTGTVYTTPPHLNTIWTFLDEGR